MEDLIQKLRILTRTELTLAKLHGRRWATQVIAYTTAVLLGLVAVVLVNYAVFSALTESFGVVVAALIMATGDAILAMGIAVWAGSLHAGNEEALVGEIQDMVLTQLEADATGVGKDLAHIRSVLTGTGGLGSLSALVPLIGTAIDLLKRQGD